MDDISKKILVETGFFFENNEISMNLPQIIKQIP